MKLNMDDSFFNFLSLFMMFQTVSDCGMLLAAESDDLVLWAGKGVRWT